MPGEVVLDRVLARKNGINLGDSVSIVDANFTVVGLSNQTAAATNYYTFMSLPDAARLLRAGNRVSYFLVEPAPGHTPSRSWTLSIENFPRWMRSRRPPSRTTAATSS